MNLRDVERVGRKIRQLRKERKLTQTELAVRIGIQQSDLSRMEKGEYRVSLDTLFRILAEFGVGMAEFFGEPHTEEFPPRDVLLVRELRRLSPEARREVEAFLLFKARNNGGGAAETRAPEADHGE